MNASILNDTSILTPDLTLAFDVVRATEVIVLATTIWILISTLVYGYKTKKWLRKSSSTSLDRGVIYSCCVAAVALSIPRLVFTCTMLFIPLESISSNCEILMDASNGLHFCAIYPPYFFLWLRQRAIYGHPTAKKLAGKAVLGLSWAVLVVLSVCSIGLTCAFIIPQSYKLGPNGCVLHNNSTGQRADRSLYYVLAGFSTLCQFTFLGLFIYPMVKCGLDQVRHRQQPFVTGVKGKGSTSSSVAVLGRHLSSKARNSLRRDKNRPGNQASSNCLERTIRRSVVSTAVTVLSDVITMILVSFVIPVTLPRNLTDAVYDVSILVNTLSILATFGGNRRIVTAICRVTSDEDKKRTTLDSNQSYGAQGNYIVTD